MAINGVGKSKVTILLGKHNGKTYQLAVIGDVTLERSINTPACLKFKCVRDDVSVEEGEYITLNLDGVHDMFFGVITDFSFSGKVLTITAYDFLYYLNQNTYSRNFGNIKASDLYIKMADEFGFPMVNPPTVEDTGHVITNVIMQNEKPLDLMVDALKITKEATGIQYYMFDAFRNLSLFSGYDGGTLMVTTFALTHYNCGDYTVTKSIKDLKNYIKINTRAEKDADKKSAIAQDAESIKNYGKLTYEEDVDDGTNINAYAQQILKDKNVISWSISASDVVGEPRIFGGSSVYVDLYSNGVESREYIRGWFCVQNVTHKFSKGYHTMDLELEIIRMDNDWNNKEVIM